MRTALAALLIWAACDRDTGEPNREYMPDMVSSVPYDTYAPNPVTRDGRTWMKPSPGTVPRGYAPLPFGAGPEQAVRAGHELANPLPANDLVQARGRIVFDRMCSGCHGHDGLGDGLVALRFPRPPSLLADHARGLPDGQLFHIATFGQGVMPAHGAQVSVQDRWAVVHHIRKLQGGAR